MFIKRYIILKIPHFFSFAETMSEEEPKKKVKTANEKRKKKTTTAQKRDKPSMLERFSATPREYKFAVIVVLLAVVFAIIFPTVTEESHHQMEKKKCPFGFQSRSNVNLETDLPSWHPKLVSYDVEDASKGGDKSAFGPPMLKKN